MSLSRALANLSLLVFIPSLGIPLQIAAGEPQLKPFTARFQVNRNSLPLGTLNMHLSINSQGSYRYSGHTKPSKLLNWFATDEVLEQSLGNYFDNRIIPMTYEYLQQNDKSKRHSQLDFDWTAGKVWTDSDGQRWAQPLVAGTHDKYSQQLALRLDLANGKQEISYPVADGGKIKSYRYRVEGESHVNLPYGRLRCVQISRSKASKPADYTIWMAPELNYLPVKIEHRRTSGYYVIELMQLGEG